MPHARNYLYESVVQSGVALCEAVQCNSGIVCHGIACETVVIFTGAQCKCDVRKVLHRRVLQRFATGHRSCSCKVVGIERSKSLAAVTAFRNSVEVYSVGVYILIQECQTKKLFPCPLLALYCPTVQLAIAIRDLWNEMQRRRIVIAVA